MNKKVTIRISDYSTRNELIKNWCQAASNEGWTEAEMIIVLEQVPATKPLDEVIAILSGYSTWPIKD